MSGTDITYIGLAASVISLIIPVFILYRYKTGLIKPMLISFARMILQLFIVGIYLKYIFELDSALLNFLWVFVMIVAAGFSVAKRSNLRYKHFLVPIIVSILVNTSVNMAIYALFILNPADMSSARYLIPIMGMVIGNTLSSSIVGIRNYIQNITKNSDIYNFYLMAGASTEEAEEPFITDAMREAFNPYIASTAVIGLIWLPGMMTGQILGGSEPLHAIKYQISIIITIFVGSVITVFTAIKLLRKLIFDDFGNIKKELIN